MKYTLWGRIMFSQRSFPVKRCVGGMGDFPSHRSIAQREFFEFGSRALSMSSRSRLGPSFRAVRRQRPRFELRRKAPVAVSVSGDHGPRTFDGRSCSADNIASDNSSCSSRRARSLREDCKVWWFARYRTLALRKGYQYAPRAAPRRWCLVDTQFLGPATADHTVLTGKYLYRSCK